jgi:hypothetical protein
MATLIMTAKLNDIEPQAWLADVLAASLTRLLPGWSNCFRGIGHRRPSTLKRPDLRPPPYEPSRDTAVKANAAAAK